MKLSSKEKKFIKHNKKNLSAEQIAVELKAPVEDVLEYLKKQLSDDKFEKYRLVNSKNTNSTASPFSFKNFFKDLIFRRYLSTLIYVTNFVFLIFL